MQSIENINETIPSSWKPLFSPFLNDDPLRIQEDFSLIDGSAFYNEKHNMIIVNPWDNTVQFYDATTLLPLKEREPKKVDSIITDFSYDQETDTYLLSCEDANLIYSYNASRNELKKLKEFDNCVIAVEFVNPSSYAFSLTTSPKLFIGTLDQDEILTFDSKGGSPYYIQSLNKSRLLLSTIGNGNLVVYRTDKLPKMPIFCSVKVHKRAYSVVRIKNAMVHGKEVVITLSEKDLTINTFSEIDIFEFFCLAENCPLIF